MTVKVTFISKDLTEGLKDGIYDVRYGLTVGDIIRAVERTCGVTLPPERERQLQYILNGKTAYWYSSDVDGSKMVVQRSVVDRVDDRQSPEIPELVVIRREIGEIPRVTHIQKTNQQQEVYAMNTMHGYAGKLLFVNLTDKTYEVRPLTEELAKDFIGGPSLGAKILYEEMPANTDAFAPESLLGIVSGPTNGTGPFMGGRYTVVSKSPVTGGWNDANSGGNFGPKLRKSGFDAVFFKGISDSPVYLFIDNGEVSFRDASHLWGKTTIETENAIYEELGDNKVGIALIGPAGERLSNMAAIMNDTHRAAGRGGTGAVMGSKRLKALVCRGDLKIEVRDKAEVLAINKETIEWEKGPVAEVVKVFSQWGTGSLYEDSTISADAGIKNWSGAPRELTDAAKEALTSAAMDKLYKRKKFACNACPVGCGAIYEIKDGPWQLEETGRPEYETSGNFGSMMLNADPESVNYCNFLCNEYGFDTISFGATVAWAMECYNKGLFTLEEMGGIDLNWGDRDAIVAMSEAVCHASTEMGKILNGASREAARHYNRGFDFLVDASGIEIPQHDARRSPGLARTYQYDPTPGRHVKGGLGFTTHGAEPPEQKYSFKDTGKRDLDAVVDLEITNASGYCQLSEFGLPPGSKIRFLNALTDFNYSEEDARNLGLRSFTLRHAFNLREGMRRKDFKISDRIVGKPPLKEGPLENVIIDNEKLGDNFYSEIGWDLQTALPPREFLEKVGGLDFVITDLYGDK
jgi:aldehyde:ferredoxin oxidoreductase